MTDISANEERERERETKSQEIEFSRAGMLVGFRETMPITLSVVAYGLVFGVLAKQTHLSLLETTLMSLLINAGSAQLAALNLWVAPLPDLAIILTTLIINLRHIPMGASLYPYINKLKALPRNLSLFFLSDGSWALTMGQFQQGKRNGAFLLGSGAAMWLGWSAATVIGYLLGNLISNPQQWGLDFAFLAVFIALLVAQWKGRKSALPWTIAAMVAIAASYWLPDKWYILLGGLAGSLAGAWLNDD